MDFIPKFLVLAINKAFLVQNLIFFCIVQKFPIWKIWKGGGIASNMTVVSSSSTLKIPKKANFWFQFWSFFCLHETLHLNRVLNFNMTIFFQIPAKHNANNTFLVPRFFFSCKKHYILTNSRQLISNMSLVFSKSQPKHN